MRVNVGRATTDLSKLLARVEAGEEVEIARDGVPVARLVRVEPATPGATFLAAREELAGSVVIGDDLELTEAELDDLLSDDAWPSCSTPTSSSGTCRGRDRWLHGHGR